MELSQKDLEKLLRQTRNYAIDECARMLKKIYSDNIAVLHIQALKTEEKDAG